MSIASEREEIEKELTTIERAAEQEGPEYFIKKYTGPDWHQLSQAEAEVFQIELTDMPRLVAVYELYYDALEITTSISKERAKALRTDLPWLTNCSVQFGEWERFAKLFGISQRNAAAFFEKYHFWDVRQGHVNYSDEEKDNESF